jgi:hypothetical protein
MPGIRRLLLIAALSILLAAVSSAQALVEYAAGAAVGTAGSAGGKAVSNGLDRIFKQLDGKAKQAAGTTPATTQKKKYADYAPANAKAEAVVSGPSKAVLPKARTPRVEGSIVPDVELPAGLSALALPAPSVPSAPRIIASAEELARITPGASRQDVVERLGTPAFRVRFSGDGHVQEIYRYSANGADLGSVRVVDGEVASVKIRSN